MSFLLAENKYLQSTILKSIPQQSGCYLFANSKQQIIYVGKTKNLHSRVTSYFRLVDNRLKTKMVQSIANINFIVTNNEKEALILEHNLIKKHQPQYNILLKDDKSYPYLVVTRERHPQLTYTRRLTENYHKKYFFVFGPLPYGAKLLSFLKVLQTLVPFRRCRFQTKQHPCTYFYLNQCSGACFKEVDLEFYQTQITILKHLLKMDHDELADKLKKQISTLSQQLQFENAAKVKSLLDSWQMMTMSQTASFTNHKNFDVCSYYQTDSQVCFLILFFRQGKLLFKEHHVLSLPSNSKLRSYFRWFLQSTYNWNPVPEQIIIPERLTSPEIKLLYGSKLKIACSQQAETSRLLKMATSNAQAVMTQEQIIKNRKVNYNQGWDALSCLMPPHSANPVNQIDFIDISNWGYGWHVGAVCVFKHGVPIYHAWRKFNLTSSQSHQKSDVWSIAATINKQYQGATTSLPDLIIVDGGHAQQQSAYQALKKIKLLSIVVAGAVKNNKHQTDHFLNYCGSPVKISKANPAFLLLTKMQTQTHNYAVRALRKKNRKTNLQSSLSNIPGWGEARIRTLIQHFKTWTNIEQQTFASINKVIHHKTASQNLVKYLKKKK